MAKRTFAARTFKTRTFHSGTWNGVGAATITPGGGDDGFPAYYLGTPTEPKRPTKKKKKKRRRTTEAEMIAFLVAAGEI